MGDPDDVHKMAVLTQDLAGVDGQVVNILFNPEINGGFYGPALDIQDGEARTCEIHIGMRPYDPDTSQARERMSTVAAFFVDR